MPSIRTVAPRARALGYVLAVPPAAVTLLLAILATSEAQRIVLIGTVPADNLSEAAAAGAAASVVRLIGAGESPMRVRAVRPELLGVTWVTPLEAAVLDENLDMVQLLDRMGVIVGDERRRLACLAADIEKPPIARYLAPAGASCDAGVTIAEIRRRTG